MKISIFTICYNNESDIRETIESVVNQTYSDVEYIIVDGASKDCTISIVNEYKEKIAKIISEPDKGLYDAINKGLRHATGDIVGMIHAGDRLNNEKVFSIIANFYENNDVDITYANSLIVDANNVIKRINTSPEFNKELVRDGWMPSHQSIYLRRELLERYGYYRLDIGSAADYEWFVRYFYKFADDLRIRRINETLITFTLGGVSSSSKLKKVFSSKHKQMLRKCWEVNGLEAPKFVIFKKWVRLMKMYIRAFVHNTGI